MTEWVAYSRFGRIATLVREAGKPIPAGFSSKRAATPAEIQTELERRSERDQARAKTEAFHAREDYKLASQARNALELMDADNNPLDKLTLTEWRALVAKLERP